MGMGHGQHTTQKPPHQTTTQNMGASLFLDEKQEELTMKQSYKQRATDSNNAMIY